MRVRWFLETACFLCECNDITRFNKHSLITHGLQPCKKITMLISFARGADSECVLILWVGLDSYVDVVACVGVLGY